MYKGIRRFGSRGAKVPAVWVGILVVFLLTTLGLWLGRQYQLRKWMGFERFTVISFSNKVTVESVDPQTLTGIRIVLPDDLDVDTLNGRGTWRAGVLLDMANKYGWRWAADSVADYLGVAYTDYEGQMSIWDRYVWNGLVAKSRWKDENMGDVGLTVIVVESDGQKGQRLASAWDQVARDWFISTNLAAEEYSLRILNASTAMGLGAKVARAIERSGIRVISIDTGETRSGLMCEIRGLAASRNSYSVAFVKKILECSFREDKNGVDKEIELVLGADMAKNMTGN